MRNLQTRGFALMRWRLRKTLFGIDEKPPEYFTQSKRRILYSYTIATWLYRFILFLGIAIMVYYLFFKTLGIILFVIEIIYFIVQPIYKEVKVWWRMRKLITLNRNTISLLVILVMLIALLFIPWQNRISLPATLSYQTQTLYSELAAQVTKVHVKKGQWVQQGQLLVELDSPQLSFQIAQSKSKLEQLQWQARNEVHFQAQLEKQPTLNKQIAHMQAQLNHLKQQQDKLSIKAPFSGKVESLSEDLQTTAWLKKQQGMLVVINPAKALIEAYVNHQDNDKLYQGLKGTFIADNIDLAKLQVTLRHITTYKASMLYQQHPNDQLLSFIKTPAPNSAYHASTLGGSIVVHQTKEGELQPQENIFLATLSTQLPKGYRLNQVTRGEVLINVEQKSIAQRIWQQVLIFLVKESSF